MKLYDGGSSVLIIVAVVTLIGLASSYVLGPDNDLEETAEVIIEMQTGMDFDLSPSSPEK